MELIKIEDRLPDLNQEVLVQTTDENNSGSFFRLGSFFEPDEQTNDIAFAESETDIVYEMDELLYWVKIPSLPD